MHSRDVRRTFLEFFAKHGHQVVPSSPLVLPADPSLLFANAGMNQFKEVFRGHDHRPYRRAASSQKCLRVSGKHNDLEEVGRTPRHHTFFEMLGNFSFGDYFKREAIVWGWQLMTEVYRLPAERLHATVFAGDDEFPGDEEAARFWESEAGVPPSRVTAMGRKDNFWQMGDTGPAGPCREIHIDLRPDDPQPATPASDPERFMELWNLVFMQFDLQPGGKVGTLPAPSVDTGAGLERVTAVLQGVRSNFDTDLFQPIICGVAAEAGVVYGAGGESDVSLRVIADHLRAIAFLVSEGVIPGPEKRGAVLRRIMRRAMRHGRLLGAPSPFLWRHLEEVAAVLGEPYPELREHMGTMQKVVRREEERFDRTLADGFALLDERIDAVLAGGSRRFPGDEAFQLESERGLPLDLVRDALEERGLALDDAAYDTARARHVETSRVLKADEADRVELETLAPWREQGSSFVGRETLRVEAARILGLLRDGQAVGQLGAGETGEAILDESPFYPEAGGQVGDHGLLVGGEGRARVTGVHAPIRGVTLHRVEVLEGTLVPGAVVVAEVDAARRRAIMRHHTATHLLHAALRRQLGTHVRQAGSLVEPERLRFDFAHYEPVEPEVLRDIEAEVNEAVLADHPVETVEMPIDDALASGAMAFFGDRYGETVRVVRIGDVSLELCGGTHVARTGEIGTTVLSTERGVAAGVRRIEALSGLAALARAREEFDRTRDLAQSMGVAAEAVPDELERRLEALRRLRRENEELKLKLAHGGSAADATDEEVDGVRVIARRVDGLAKGPRRDLLDGLRQQNPGAVVILVAGDEGKVALLVGTGREVGDAVDARAVVKALATIAGGAGGGGRPDLAEAGGRNPEAIPEVLARAAEAVRAARSR
ncbi:MAG: alanine--tRNA ligase [Acidobacteria bacterium]|nr:alanine--tRNA ligase [Acidobacteriota bacterium]